jgi:hypothetical protein
MAVLLALYLVLVLLYAFALVVDPLPVVRAIGWALLVLPLLGVWALGAELLFGVRAEKLARRLEAEGGVPADEPLTDDEPGDETAARDAVFARYAQGVREHPESWQHWFRLGLAYDVARDRRRARWAVRTAITLERENRESPAT